MSVFVLLTSSSYCLVTHKSWRLIKKCNETILYFLSFRIGFSKCIDAFLPLSIHLKGVYLITIIIRKKTEAVELATEIE